MPVRGGGQGSQGLRSGHAGGLGNVFGFFLGGGDQYGTLGVTCAWVLAHTADVEDSGRWAEGA